MPNFFIKRICDNTTLLLLVLLMLFSTVGLEAQRSQFHDGPYVDYVDDNVHVTWIDKGNLFVDTIAAEADYTFEVPGFPTFSLQELSIESSDEVDFMDVQKFAAISDIHGQFDVFEHLMISNGIADSLGNWTFGGGHLLVLGDMLDRGDKVLDVLWYLYHLEKQAAAAGGKVHVLLGNHEMMVINGEAGYLHKNYRFTSGITQRRYFEFFGKNTFWGRWLSSKNTVISVNDIAFVHGGFSPQVIKKRLTFGDINDVFKTKALFSDQETLHTDVMLRLLCFENGPLWYRGNAQPYSFDTEGANELLEALNKKGLVIGHTSMPRVMGLYSNRIILIDSSIKFGETGELLFFDDEKFSRAQMDGSKIPLVAENEEEKRKDMNIELYAQRYPSIFVNLDRTFRTIGNVEDENLLVEIYFDKHGFTFSGEVKGYQSKDGKDCKRQRLRILLSESELLNFGFSSSNNLTLELPCDMNADESWSQTYIEEEIKENGTSKNYKRCKILIKDRNGDSVQLPAVLAFDKIIEGTN